MVLKTKGMITKDATVSIGPGMPNTTRPKATHTKKKTAKSTKKTVNNNNLRKAPSIDQSHRRVPRSPTGPAPSSQPSFRPTVDLKKLRQNSINKREVGQVDTSVLNVPRGGASATVRQSIVGKEMSQRPVPGGGRPRPAPRTVRQTLPKVQALYDYDAQDVDEISFQEGDTFELIKECEYIEYKAQG